MLIDKRILGPEMGNSCFLATALLRNPTLGNTPFIGLRSIKGQKIFEKIACLLYGVFKCLLAQVRLQCSIVAMSEL